MIGQQPREGAGRPTGGRWVALTRRDPGVTLDDNGGPGTHTVTMPPGTVTYESERVAALLQPGQPVLHRALAARSWNPGVGRVASHDPDPVVRAIATGAWDLDDSDRARLDGDAAVGRVLTVLRR